MTNCGQRSRALTPVVPPRVNASRRMFGGPALVIATTPLLAPLLAAAPLAPASSGDDPVVTKVTFSSHTNDDNKDHDTGVYVKVHTKDGQTLIAHADNRDNGGTDATEYNDNSDHSFSLDVDADGLKKSAATGFRVQVCQQTNGNDTWKMRSSVVVKFSDGANLTASSGDVELKNNGACTSYGG
jgi:hypothetical protein